MQGTTRTNTPGAVRPLTQSAQPHPAAGAAAVTRRQHFDARADELHKAPNDSKIFWTTPWALAKADLAQLEGGHAWPDDLFQFFIDSIQDQRIIPIRGAHSFFDVLFAYRASLSGPQKAQLGTALNAPINLGYSGWAASCRLKEYIHGPQVLEAVVRERVQNQGSHPRSATAAIHNAISLFKTFEIKSLPGSVSKTQCTVSTELNEKWTFIVDVPYWRFGAREGSAPPREDLYTSRFHEVEDAPMECLEDTLSILELDIYDSKHRTDTLLSVPGALADSQKVFAQGAGWEPAVFEGFLSLGKVMHSNEVPASDRFGVLFEALLSPCRTTSPRGPAPAPIFSILNMDQKVGLLSWLGDRVHQFEDAKTRDLVARFVVDMYPKAEADKFFEAIARNHVHKDSVQALLNTWNDYRSREQKGDSRSRSSSSVPGLSVSPAREQQRVQSLPARGRLSAFRNALPPFTPRSLSTPRDEK